MTSESSSPASGVHVRFLLSVVILALFVACGDDRPGPDNEKKTAITLRFVTTSDKYPWLREAIDEFEESKPTSPNEGLPIEVDLIEAGSSRSVMELAFHSAGDIQLVSPAASFYIQEVNEAQQALGRPIIASTPIPLARTALVIGMAQSVAESLGYPEVGLGWRDLATLASNPQLWKTSTQDQFGSFRLAWCDPEASNAGLLTLMASLAAATRRATGPHMDELSRPETGRFLQSFEAATVAYSPDPGFLARRLAEQGSKGLSAIVVYERDIFNAYLAPNPPVEALVAIQPTEGTFECDHPVALLEQNLDPEARSAAELLVGFLLSEKVQDRLLLHGFRTADRREELPQDLAEARGLTAGVPPKLYEIPYAAVRDASLGVWRRAKLPAHVWFIVETSASMAVPEDNRIGRVARLIDEICDHMHERDTVGLITIDASATTAMQPVFVREARHRIRELLASLEPRGGVALIEQLPGIYQEVVRQARPQRLHAVVLCGTGFDALSEEAVGYAVGQMRRIQTESPGEIPVFSVGLTSGAELDILRRLSNATGGRPYFLQDNNVERLARELSAFW